MWFRSADIIERPSMNRRAMAKVVSRIGIPRAMRGMENPERVDAPEATRAAVADSMNPMERLPASPRKTRAGWRLWGMNPPMDPIRAISIRPAATCPSWNAIQEIAPQAITLSPLARLSRPSMMLRALVAPTIHRMVRGTPNTPKSMRVPPMS